MKKYLDFTSQSVFSTPFFEQNSGIDGALKRSLGVKKKFEKIKLGLTGNHFSHVCVFSSQEHLIAALFTYLAFHEVPQTGRNHILLEATASKAVLDWAKHFKKMGMLAHLVAPNQTLELSIEQLHEKISPKTLLFSQRLLHPILGIMQPYSAKLAAYLKTAGVMYHLDVTQAYGESILDFSLIEADLVSFDLSSIDPNVKGAILFSKTPFQDFISKSDISEIENLDSILEGLETFLEKSSDKMLKLITAKMKLKNALEQAIPGIRFCLHPSFEAINKLLISIPKVHAEALGYCLMNQKIYVDLGGNKEQTLLSLLETLGYPAQQAASTFSLTIPLDLSDDMVTCFVNALKSAHDMLLKGAT